MNKKFLILIVLLFLSLVTFLGYEFFESKNKKQEDKVSASNQNQFKSLKGQEIVLKNLKSGDAVKSPIVIEGEVSGKWFFEGSFPVYIVDWDGKIIGQGVAMAQSDWMTENKVPFVASFVFDTKQISGQYSNKGSLILKKDNPSGLPENDDSFEMPIIFEKQKPASFSFSNKEGKSIEIIFNNENDTAILNGLGYSDLLFNIATSGSGARYENVKNNMVLWNKGNNISIFLKDSLIFEGQTK